ncbi:MAG: VCBS repeat-containing protein [Planctomycetes bacterium]|nr:VCBS repeat-containing protein [Planctomycetota bacterium]
MLIRGRTYINGSSVTTVTYGAADRTRTPVGIDFNGDAKIDPVVGYAPSNTGGLIQILLSKGNPGTVDFSSLTIDGNGRWTKLMDVAVADIDADGAWDILGASADGVTYLHNPGPGRTTVMRDWGAGNPDDEYLAGSTATLTNDQIEAILSDILPPGTNIDDYDVQVEQGYTRVTAGDIDDDADNDVIASRRLRISLTPKAGKNAPPVDVIQGELQIFINPGFAQDGLGWTLATIGRHERYTELDRQGATAIMLYDMDNDGDLDVVSAARDDINTQIAWFENPGRARIGELNSWTQWRIGSVRDAVAFDLADVTGDGRVDVVAVGQAQQQLVLFEQPADGAKRDYEWDSYVLVTFESYAPLDVKALDIDHDGKLELVIGGTNGAVRYFEPPASPRDTWTGNEVVTFTPGGDVSLLGYGDLDADGDLDLVAALNDDSTDNDNADRVTWIRNSLP